MDVFEEFSNKESGKVVPSQKKDTTSAPLFNLKRVDVSLSRNTSAKRRQIIKAVCNNAVIVFATSDCYIFRWNLESEAEEIEISKKHDDHIHNLFFDHTGSHLIISLKNGDNFYLHSKSNKPKKLSRLQGRVDSVAFERSVPVDDASATSITVGGDIMTKSFLLGTSLGLIYEVLIDSNTGKEKICQIVHQLDQQISITSLYYDVIQTGESEANRSSSMFILCATSNPTRMYHYIGAATSLQHLFAEHASQGASAFVELPGSLGDGISELVHSSTKLSSTANTPGSRYQYFAMLTENAIYNGDIYFSSSDGYGSNADVLDNAIVEAKLTNYPNSGSSNSNSAAPFSKSIILSEFHMLLLSHDKRNIHVMSILDGSLVQTLPLPVSGTGYNSNQGYTKPIGLIKDYSRNMMWVYSENTILFQILLSPGVSEDRNVWKIYMELGMRGHDDALFDVATRYCHSTASENELFNLQGEYYLQCNQIIKAAYYFAHSNLRSFDEIVLVLLGLTKYITHTQGIKNMVASDIDADKRSVNQSHHNISSTTGEVLTNIITRKSGAGVYSEFPNTRDVLELHAVRVYIEEVLKTLPNTAKSQRTMIATWLCEIYLHLIQSATYNTSCADSDTSIWLSNQGYTARGEPTASCFSPMCLPTESTMLMLFKDFLRANRSILDQPTTIQLLASRNMRHMLLFYAQIIGDYDKVIGYFITDNRYAEVIQLLNDAPLERIEKIIYKTAPILIEFAPEITINLLHNKSQSLQFKSLLPSLLRYCEILDKFLNKQKEDAAISKKHHARARQDGSAELNNSVDYGDSDSDEDDGGARMGSNLNTDFEGNRVNFAIIFLEKYIERAESEGLPIDAGLVYHTYMWLLMKYDTKHEERILNLVRPWLDVGIQQSAASVGAGNGCNENVGKGGIGVEFPIAFKHQYGIELSYVLRLCKQFQRKKTSVYIYVLLNLPEQAIKIALEVSDFQLAMTIASLPVDDIVKKQLWMLIAKYVLKKENINTESGHADSNNTGAVKQCLLLIANSNGVLTLGDLLPHLPDFTDISLLKDDICNILSDNGSKLERVKTEINELSESTENIVKELDSMKSKGAHLSLEQKCEECVHQHINTALFSKPFYLFPCGHGYHADCLVRMYVGESATKSLNGFTSATFSDAANTSNTISNCVLDPILVSRIRSLSEQINSLSNKIVKDSQNNDKRVMLQLDLFQNELDSYIAADCPLCGDIMIKLVAVSLCNTGNPQADAKEAKSWDI